MRVSCGDRKLAPVPDFPTFNPATGTISVVPEPSTYVIAGLSSVGLAGMMRWRKRRAAKSGTGAIC